MGPLLFITLWFVVGLLLGSGQGPALQTALPAHMLFWTGLALVTIGATLTLVKPKPLFLMASALGLGLASGALGRPTRESPNGDAPPGGRCTVTGRIREARQDGKRRWTMEIDHAQAICREQGASPSQAGSLTLDRVILWGTRPLPQGTAAGLPVIGACRMSPVRRTGPRRMHCTSLAVWAAQRRWSLGGLRTAIRKRTDSLLAESAPSKSDLLWAILLGSRLRHRGGIKAAFAKLGIAHVLVVSGLHLGMLALLALGLWRLVFTLFPHLAERYPAGKASALLALPAVWTYVLVAGGSAATIRAGIMATSLLLGLVADRPASAARTLVLAGIVLLIWRPEWLSRPGFQLSFAATAALVWLGRAWTERNRDATGPSPPGTDPLPRTVLRKAGGFLGTALLASLVAWMATAPLTAHWFGGLSLVGPLANLVAVPFFCWLVLPLGLAGLGLGQAWPTAGGALLSSADRLSDLAARTVVALARRSDLVWFEARPVWWQALTALALLGFAAWLVLRWQRKNKPWSFRRIGILAMVLSAWVLAITQDMRPKTQDMAVVFLGRRAGNAVLVLAPGAAVLVDTGAGRPGGRAMAAELKRRGIGRLDLVVATHPHWDHASGLVEVLGRVPTRALWVAGPSAGGLWQRLLDQARLRGIVVLRPKDTTIGSLQIQVVSVPGRRKDMDPSLSRNDNSLALRFEHRGRTLLLVGDLERQGQHLALSGGATLASDILVAPHHGSSQSFLPEFLAAVDPALVVISGHTARTQPSLYRSRGADVVLTDELGALEVRLSPNRELPLVIPLSR